MTQSDFIENVLVIFTWCCIIKTLCGPEKKYIKFYLAFNFCSYIEKIISLEKLLIFPMIGNLS